MERQIAAFRQFYEGMCDSTVTWVLTGSLSFALRGMHVGVHDIDIQTDRRGAYEIERLLASYVVDKVQFLQSERVRSHLGILRVGGVPLHIMGDMEKREDDDSWSIPPPLIQIRETLLVDDMAVPVLPLDYEYWAYTRLGRYDKAALIKRWMRGKHG